ncbi:hypothetical protein M601_007600 [Cellulophaga baltica 4]|nr:hypothetical protein M601_007600 [Cellulophaga baltica 4]
MKYLLYLSALCLLFISCEEPIARKPVRVSTPKLVKSTVERNKDLLEIEVKIINRLVKKIHFMNTYLQLLDHGFITKQKMIHYRMYLKKKMLLH